MVQLLKNRLRFIQDLYLLMPVRSKLFSAALCYSIHFYILNIPLFSCYLKYTNIADFCVKIASLVTMIFSEDILYTR